MVLKSAIAGEGIFATKTIKDGERISYFEGVVVDHDTQYSLTLDRLKINPTGDLRHLNHSCSPNTYFKGRWLYANREIQPKEELYIDYLETEKNISSHFTCNCGNDNCRGKI